MTTYLSLTAVASISKLPPNGGKWWRLKYRFQGKEKRISLGTYPTVGLKDARERREQAKKLLEQGVDPSDQRKEAKAAVAAIEQEQATTFEAVARDWFAKKKAAWTPGHQKKTSHVLRISFSPS